MILTGRLVKIKEAIENSDPGALIVPFSAAFELKVVDMSKEEKKAFEEENKATRSVGRGWSALFGILCDPLLSCVKRVSLSSLVTIFDASAG